MPDTGAPWNIPYAAPSDLVRDWPALSEDVAEAVADGLQIAASYDSVSVITATNASWPVPTLASPIVRVTVIGGGGGGGGAGAAASDGGTGGTTTFNAGGAGTVSATGGAGGKHGNSGGSGPAATLGFASGNGGGGATDGGQNGHNGAGGVITVAYLDLTGISTVNVTIGAGGSAGGGTFPALAGGRGEVLVEYRAG
jgi:hypothetical protein